MPHGEIDFEWSTDKAARNLKKHGVSFDEAATAFDDDRAVIFADEWHADEEPREIFIGYSDRNRLLFVSFVQRADNLIRIISARKADAEEHRTYEKNT